MTDSNKRPLDEAEQRVFDELAAMVHLPDDELWRQRDREVAACAAQENAGAELARMTRRATLLRDNGFTAESLRAALLPRPRETAALKHARQFVQLPQRMLVLAGGVGVGKTTAATWLALKAEDSAPGFMRASELERRGRYEQKHNIWVNERSSLVIDDLGAEVLDGKGVFRSLLDELIDRSYGKRTVLTITTNLQQDQLTERYGARALSRFEQRGCWGSSGTLDLRKELR